MRFSIRTFASLAFGRFAHARAAPPIYTLISCLVRVLTGPFWCNSRSASTRRKPPSVATITVRPAGAVHFQAIRGRCGGCLRLADPDGSGTAASEPLIEARSRLFMEHPTAATRPNLDLSTYLRRDQIAASRSARSRELCAPLPPVGGIQFDVATQTFIRTIPRSPHQRISSRARR